VFFDALGVSWEYERDGYDLGAAGWYLPDFWLPEHEVWIEIKGTYPTNDEHLRAERLRDVTEFPVYIFFGQFPPEGQVMVGYANYANIHDGSAGSVSKTLDAMWMCCRDCGTPIVVPAMEPENVYLNNLSREVATVCHCGYTPRQRWCRGEHHHVNVHTAYHAARSARFEHGESGAPR
jgi:CDGSH-type Zn-finger protein